jgi:hypothetical protein
MSAVNPTPFVEAWLLFRVCRRQSPCALFAANDNPRRNGHGAALALYSAAGALMLLWTGSALSRTVALSVQVIGAAPAKFTFWRESRIDSGHWALVNRRGQREAARCAARRSVARPLI